MPSSYRRSVDLLCFLPLLCPASEPGTLYVAVMKREACLGGIIFWRSALVVPIKDAKLRPRGSGTCRRRILCRSKVGAGSAGVTGKLV